MTMYGKRAALELSVSTIVVIVLGVTMLIIGMVLVRNIMCGALGLTGDINSKVQSEITRLFGASEGEVACLGSGSDPIQITPGSPHTIYCGINARVPTTYKIELKEITETPSGITPAKIRAEWVKTAGDTVRVSPGDRSPQKVIRLDVPSDASEGLLVLKVEISKQVENQGTFSTPTTQSLDFEIKRAGLVRASVC